MKRVLALVLSVACLLACMVFTSIPASAATVKHKVYLTNCDYSLKGWQGVSAPVGDLKIDEGSDGSYVVNRIASTDKNGDPKNYVGPGSYQVTAFSSPEPVDITGATNLVLHYYVSDPAVVGPMTYRIEFSTGTSSDYKDEWERGLTLNELVDGGLKAGWNDIKIPMSGATFDLTKWRWFRMFNFENATFSDDVIYGIDKMYFEKSEGDPLVISDCAMYTDGWEKATAQMYRVPKDYEGEEDINHVDRNYVAFTVEGEKPTGHIAPRFFLNKATNVEEDQSINVADYRYFVFDLYVSNAAAVEDKVWCMELNSGGALDKNEDSFTQKLGQLVDFQLKDGWNRVVLDVQNEGWARNTAGDGACDFSALKVFRLFNQDTVDAGEGFTIGFDNMYFWDGQNDLQDGFDYEIQTGKGLNDAHFIETSNGIGKHTDGDFYFCDASNYAILKYDVKNAATAETTELFMKTGSELKLSVSMDKENWTEVYSLPEGKETLKVGWRYFDLTDVVNYDKSGTVYVKVEDSNPANGNGGRIYETTLQVAHEVVDDSNVDPHNTVIAACDSTTGIGGGWAVDNDMDHTQGKGCVTKTIKGDCGGGGGAFVFYVKCADTRVTSYDVTNMEAIVLDFYTSNAEAMKGTRFAIEATSGNNCDAEENNTAAGLHEFVAEGKVWKNGWNTLVIPFAKLTGRTGGELNKANFNYFRIYNETGLNAGDGIKLAFDNIRLWDGSDGSIETEYTPLKISDTLYKFTIPDTYESKALWLTGNAGDTIQVSFDGETYAEVTKADGKYTLTIDTDLPNFEYTYVKTSAAVDDLKAVLTHKQLITNEDKDLAEMQNTVHSISLFTCSEGSNAVRSNPTPSTGTSCARVDITFPDADGDEKLNTFMVKDLFEVDGTGMDTFEFDVFFSDEYVMNAVAGAPKSQIELTSGGTCDQEEDHWDISAIKSGIVGEPKVGEWNHVVLPLSTAADAALQLDHANYIRVYIFVSESYKGDAEETYIAFDNFRLTDYEALAKVDVKPYVDAATDLVLALRTLLGVDASAKDVPAGAITAENIDAVKTAYDTAKAAADALPAVGSSMFKESSFLRKVKNAIADFEKGPDTPGETETTPDDNNETSNTPGGNETSNTPGGNETSNTPGGDGKETEAPKKKGCGSVVISGAVVVVAAVAAAGVMIAKKQED